MDICFVVSLFWIIYGIAGMLGFQLILSRYRGYPWTKEYIRSRGKAYLLMGITWLAFDQLLLYASVNSGIKILCIIAITIPLIVYSCRIERKYKSLLEKEKSE